MAAGGYLDNIIFFKVLHYSSPLWIIQTWQSNKSTGCPGNCCLDNHEDGEGMAGLGWHMREAKAPWHGHKAPSSLNKPPKQATK